MGLNMILLMALSAPCHVPRLETPRSGVRGRRRDKGVVSRGNHCGGVAAHEWLGRDVEISEHLVTAPAADEADGVEVNVPQEEGYGPAGEEGAGWRCRGTRGQGGGGRSCRRRIA